MFFFFRAYLQYPKSVPVNLERLVILTYVLLFSESAYDKTLEKINAILASISKKPQKYPKESESKPSSDKSQIKDKTSGDCFLNISSDSFAELLKPKIETISHLVIESLNSIFIPFEDLALYTILKSVGSIYYINLTILSYTVSSIQLIYYFISC